MGLKCPSHVQHCVPTPSPTSPSAPTPIAPQLPKGTPSPYPTRVATRTAGTPPVTPTNTPASAVSITANQTTTTRTDATPASQQSQGTEDQGSNLLLPSLGVGIPFFLLSGALLWFLWRRQTNQHKPALRGYSRTAQTSPWTSSREMQPPFALPEFVSSGAFAPRVAGASGVSPEFESTQPMPFLQLADTPSDPMTTAFAQPMLTMSLDNTLSSPQHGTFHSRSSLLSICPCNPPKPEGRTRVGERSSHCFSSNGRDGSFLPLHVVSTLGGPSSPSDRLPTSHQR
jgi:Predicted solute binding protein